MVLLSINLNDFGMKSLIKTGIEEIIGKEKEKGVYKIYGEGEGGNKQVAIVICFYKNLEENEIRML